MKLVCMILVGCLLCGCLTQRKREDITHRYLREHPATLADLCATKYPARPSTGVPVLVRDTTILSDTVRVECPDSTFVEVPTLRTRYVDRVRVDTIVDGALVDQLSASIRALETELSLSKAFGQSWRESAQNRLWRLIGLGIAAIVILLVRFKRLFGF